MPSLEKLFAVLLMSLSAFACASDDTFQSVEIGNSGHSDVSGASVLYGDQQLILGPAREKYPANLIGYARTSVGLSSPIPATTELKWVTSDNVTHKAIVATGFLIQNRELFYGFRFNFADDHVDVYLKQRVPNPAGVLDVKYIKVYSSPEAQQGAQADVP